MACEELGQVATLPKHLCHRQRRADFQLAGIKIQCVEQAEGVALNRVLNDANGTLCSKLCYGASCAICFRTLLTSLAETAEAAFPQLLRM
jgi:hypothetical protein